MADYYFPRMSSYNFTLYNHIIARSESDLLLWHASCGSLFFVEQEKEGRHTTNDR
jgi:hypothetical protein